MVCTTVQQYYCFYEGFTAGLRAFTAAVLVGIGNIVEAMLGGVLIGLLSSLSDQYFSSRWTNAWVLGVLVVILDFRSGGLLGEKVSKCRVEIMAKDTDHNNIRTAL
ncbi:hypothetical protein QUA13_11295 [Microcoleus sp. S28C3]|uniref:ABC transporter permease subunit n=1 Tax=Microcoleus sp. S28C3 TaxID=3055414 RepID=UPI002FD39A4B